MKKTHLNMVREKAVKRGECTRAEFDLQTVPDYDPSPLEAAMLFAKKQVRKMQKVIKKL